MASSTDPGSTGAGIRLTYADYLSLPEDGLRYEILDGELAVTASPTTLHQRVSRDLEFALHRQVRELGLGEVFNAPVDVILADTTITVPDLVFIARENAAIVTTRAIEGPPDLIVEILSPSTAQRDRGVKAQLFARYGVREYWIVDPEERTLEILRRVADRFEPQGCYEGDTVLRCTGVLDGVEIGLAEVWPAGD
jgi:Uma2 family endonuclease